MAGRATTLIIIFLFTLLLIVGTGMGLALFSTRTVETILEQAIAKADVREDIQYESVEGNIIQGVTFEQLEITNLAKFPVGTILRIQSLFVNLTDLGVHGLTVKIKNARLRFPGAEPIVIEGGLRDEILAVNVYSKDLDIHTLLDYFPAFKKKLYGLKGSAKDIDLYVKGEYTSPVITGSFMLDEFDYRGITLTETPGEVDLHVLHWNNEMELKGIVSVLSGTIRSKRTLVKLNPGKITFAGEANNPTFDLKGSSTIEKIKIAITLKGNVREPDLHLSSDPSFPKNRLMLMLATGKTWKRTDESLDNGNVTGSLTHDFIDYFVFGGTANRFAQKLGLSEISVDFDKDKRGIGAKKAVTNKLDVGYSVAQPRDPALQGTTTQKLEGEYKVTNKLSVGVEREITSKQAEESASEEAKSNNDKVLLKYKREF